MKLWKVMSIFAMGSFFVACSETKEEEDNTPDCSNTPKLTKSCLAGEWEMGPDVLTRMAALKDFDPQNVGASLPSDIPYNQNRYVLKFVIDASSKDKPSTPDSIYYYLYNDEYECDPCLSKGTFTLSADSTSISLNMIGELADINGAFPVGVYGDTLGHIISWPASTKPTFSLPSIVKTAEVFYRSIPIE